MKACQTSITFWLMDQLFPTARDNRLSARIWQVNEVAPSSTVNTYVTWSTSFREPAHLPLSQTRHQHKLANFSNPPSLLPALTASTRFHTTILLSSHQIAASSQLHSLNIFNTILHVQDAAQDGHRRRSWLHCLRQIHQA